MDECGKTKGRRNRTFILEGRRWRQCGKSEGRREEEDTFWTLGGEEGREGGRGREEM